MFILTENLVIVVAILQGISGSEIPIKIRFEIIKQRKSSRVSSLSEPLNAISAAKKKKKQKKTVYFRMRMALIISTMASNEARSSPPTTNDPRLYLKT